MKLDKIIFKKKYFRKKTEYTLTWMKINQPQVTLNVDLATSFDYLLSMMRIARLKHIVFYLFLLTFFSSAHSKEFTPKNLQNFCETKREHFWSSWCRLIFLAWTLPADSSSMSMSQFSHLLKDSFSWSKRLSVIRCSI